MRRLINIISSIILLILALIIAVIFAPKLFSIEPMERRVPGGYRQVMPLLFTEMASL